MSDNINIEKSKESNLDSVDLVVTYEGSKSALSSGNYQNISTVEIDAYVDSLKALSGIIKEANKIINRNNIDISIEISTPKEGSVKSIVKLIFKNRNEILTVTSFSLAFLTFLGFEANDIVDNFTSYHKKIEGHTIIEKKERDNVCEIHLIDSEGKEHIETFSSELCKLCENQKIKNNFCKMVEPVKKFKVKEISVIRSGAKKGFSVDKNNVHFYDIERAEEVEVREFVGEFKIETLSFHPQGKWKLYNNETPAFIARIEDKEFLHKINNNREFFLKDSNLACKIIVKQNPNAIKQKNKYYIREIKNKHPTQK